MKVEHPDYSWQDLKPTYAHVYLLPKILKLIRHLCPDYSSRVLDLGCGNGYVAAKLAQLGYSVIDVDISPDGIKLAQKAYPQVKFYLASIYDEHLVDLIREVDCVLTLEVIEHLFYPRKLLEQSYQLLKPGGWIIVSTPYHGYLKNLMISLINGWDRHFRVDQDGGHIKFFSKRTLARMAQSVGFKNLSFYGVGRLPWLWKAMIMIAQKPI